MPTAKTAAKAEALGEHITFDFDGETYEITPASEWDLDALEAFENDKVVTCVRLILGPDQWMRFRAAHKTVGDLNRMFAAVQRAGVGSGN
jgi:hypothetical protein